MSSYNFNSIALKVKTQAEKILVREAELRAKETIFNVATQQMMQDFQNDPVTKEIQGGISADNASNTLVGVREGDGKNLFSFIGFDAGSDPTEAIIPFLDPNSPEGPDIRYQRGSKTIIRGKSISFQFIVKTPDLETIYTSTPMPWAPGLSWAERIEKGMPGVGSFINSFDFGASRSGGGLQTKNVINPSARFKPRPYLSQIIQNFLKYFRGSLGRPRKI